ncbi:MAG TPA: hypothetical protein VGN48_18135 [Pedococcus sp.]|nr:hypothetical protein [Pedococcus sp.]
MAGGVLVALQHDGYPTAGSLAAVVVVGAGLCLVARRRHWILPSADAWSPTRAVPARYRIHDEKGRVDDSTDSGRRP